MPLVLALLLASSPARFAVVVGANAPAPGRQPLRFAHLDAREMAEVLVRTGEFPAANVRVLLDPEPDEVLRTLDADLAIAAETAEGALLLFYYSGHADTESLFPGGRPLALTELRARLDSPRATVRIGIVDACRGGGWTRAKGVTPGPPLQLRPPLELNSEGSALLASSSGMESAHESEDLAGSFFTHHLAAGLRGAADRNGDGEVTLGEAFAYARELTVRDSSLHAEPQHPSFLINLRGRSDLPLARVSGGEGVVELRQEEGPIQVVQLTTGLVLLELPSGRRAVRVAVPPGRYLVRARSGEGMRGREIAVEGTRATIVEEANLTLFGSPRLAVKSDERARTLATTLPEGAWLFGVAAGEVGIGELVPVPGYPTGLSYRNRELLVPIRASVGLTSRLELSFPFTLAWRFGEPGAIEWVASGGATHAGRLSQSAWAWTYGVGAGLGLRSWVGSSSSLVASALTYSQGAFGSGDLAAFPSEPSLAPTAWSTAIGIAWSHTLAGVMTANLGVSLVPPDLTFGASSSARLAPERVALKFGAVRWNVARHAPLLQFHLRSGLSLDVDGGYWWTPGPQAVMSSTGYFLAGVSWAP